MRRGPPVRIAWLWCWISVIAVGCSGAGASPSVGSAAPTLLGMTRVPPTPTSLLRLLRTPIGAATIMRVSTLNPANGPPLLTLLAPACFETSAGSLWCFGLILNPNRFPVQGIHIRIYLVDADGTALAYADGVPALHLLAAGESLPYGVRFDVPPERFAGPVAEVMDAQGAANIGLATLQLSATQENGAARVTVRNMGERAASDVELCATLIDSQGRVIGYRTARLAESLPAKDAASLTLELFPAIAAPYTVRASGVGFTQVATAQP